MNILFFYKKLCAERLLNCMKKQYEHSYIENILVLWEVKFIMITEQ